MATSAAFASLAVPAPDDTMEMSSPANRNLDDDIDIDFDDYQGGVQLHDEQMLEDGDAQRPGTATDELMEEDPLSGEHVEVTEEFIMQEDAPQPLQEEDEELIDYSEGDEYQQDEQVLDAAVASAIPSADVGTASHMKEGLIEITEGPEDVIEQVLEETVTASEEAGHTGGESLAATEDFAAKAEANDEVTRPGEDVLPTSGEEDYRSAGENLEGEPHASEAVEGVQSVLLETSAPGAEDVLEHELSITTAPAVPTDGPSTPTDTGLHPTTIRFAHHTLPLFKSKHQPDGLLTDDNLASLSLADLIKNCRERLVTREIGESITDEQELILGFDHMGLMLVEDCRAAFECSLNDVMDVYLLLHQNDGIQEAPPLSLHISCQLKFASGFSIFKQAAAEGQGMSSFSLLQAGEELQHEYYGDDLVQEGENDHEDVAQENVDDQDVFGANELDDAGYAEDRDAPEAAFALANPDPDEDYPEGYEYGLHGGHREQDHTEEAPEHVSTGNENGDTSLPSEAQDTAHVQGRHQEQVGDATAAETVADDVSTHNDGFQAPTVEAAQEPNKTASSASSTTIQAEQADGDTEQFAGEGDDNEFSTFLKQYGTEDTTSTAPPKEASVMPPQDGVNPETSGATEVISAGVRLQNTNPDPDDWLNDEAYEDPTADGDEYAQEHVHRVDEGFEHTEEEYIGQADTHETQQEEEHADHPPDEADETQFHSAVDFLDNEEYEHGPEHDLYDEETDFDQTLATANEAEHTQENLEDDLAFDDDDDDYSHGPTELEATVVGSGSPLGKRSYEEHVEIEGLDDDEPEPKKARNS